MARLFFSEAVLAGSDCRLDDPTQDVVAAVDHSLAQLVYLRRNGDFFWLMETVDRDLAPKQREYASAVCCTGFCASTPASNPVSVPFRIPHSFPDSAHCQCIHTNRHAYSHVDTFPARAVLFGLPLPGRCPLIRQMPVCIKNQKHAFRP